MVTCMFINRKNLCVIACTTFSITGTFMHLTICNGDLGIPLGQVLRTPLDITHYTRKPTSTISCQWRTPGGHWVHVHPPNE